VVERSECEPLENASEHHSVTSHFAKFEPDDGDSMCAMGVVKPLRPCANDPIVCNDDGLDYGNMWGAGIGLDFNAVSSEREKAREPWDARAVHIRGVSFDLDSRWDTSLIRVGFPVMLGESRKLPLDKSAVLREGVVIRYDGSVTTFEGTPVSKKTALEDDRSIDPDNPGLPELPEGSTSEEYPGGSPTWKLPVSAGHNQIEWSDVSSPEKTFYGDFNASLLMGIQFQVHTSDDFTTPQPFFFCVRNFSFLR